MGSIFSQNFYRDRDDVVIMTAPLLCELVQAAFSIFIVTWLFESISLHFKMIKRQKLQCSLSLTSKGKAK